MMRSFFESQLRKYRDVILWEAQGLGEFMRLLMKQRNSGIKWTGSEKAQLRRYTWELAFHVPILFAFLLPGGFLLIPVLAEVMDRRKRSRKLDELRLQASGSDPMPAESSKCGRTAV